MEKLGFKVKDPPNWPEDVSFAEKVSVTPVNRMEIKDKTLVLMTDLSKPVYCMTVDRFGRCLDRVSACLKEVSPLQTQIFCTQNPVWQRHTKGSTCQSGDAICVSKELIIDRN